MFWPSIIGGLSLGAIGSVHCVGMCGPLALALPVYHLSGLQRFVAILFYQLGRVTTYASLGFLFGVIGRNLYVAGIQQWFSVSLGVVILIMTFFSVYMKKNVQARFLRQFYLRVQKIIGSLLQTGKGYGSFYIIGLANGLLPCGMVYIAIAAALSSTAIAKSVLFMLFFGLGTFPAMMLVSYFGKMVSQSSRSSMRKAIPYFVAAMGLLLILRGLNLDIPFISPAMPAVPGSVVSCHS